MISKFATQFEMEAIQKPILYNTCKNQTESWEYFIDYYPNCYK